MPDTSLSDWKDLALYTPGPLTTSSAVKQAGLRDLGSRDIEFIALTRSVRQKLLEVAAVSSSDFVSVLMQGCGTFSVESVIVSVTPPSGKILIVSNGTYGDRIVSIAETAGIERVVLRYEEHEVPVASDIAKALEADGSITNVAMVHCETTSGIINPILEVGEVCYARGVTYFVDAMSSFGGTIIDIEGCHIDYLVTSSSKCLEGIPILGIIFARRSSLEKTKGWSRSVSLDLYHQSESLEEKNEFRFTPPIQAILSLNQALDELAAEGGIGARAIRYRNNNKILVDGMEQLGFVPSLPEGGRGYLITAFDFPEDEWFDYKPFYQAIRKKGCVIFSGKVTERPCFRIGNIGRLFERDILYLLSAVKHSVRELQSQHMDIPYELSV